jgi:MFS family permease
MCFGVPMGMFSTATQAAVYIQAPSEEIGTAAGLQRTAQYVGAIAAASLLAVINGQRATDHGLHSLAAVMGGLSAFLFVVTLFDRTIPLEASAAASESGEPIEPDVADLTKNNAPAVSASARDTVEIAI